MTPKPIVKEALAQLGNRQSKILGLVLNRVNMKSARISQLLALLQFGRLFLPRRDSCERPEGHVERKNENLWRDNHALFDYRRGGFYRLPSRRKTLERGPFGDRDRRSLHRLDSKYRAAERPARVSLCRRVDFQSSFVGRADRRRRRGISPGGFRRRAADRRESGADHREQRQGHRGGVGVCQQEEKESADHQHLRGLRQIDQDSFL